MGGGWGGPWSLHVHKRVKGMLGGALPRREQPSVIRLSLVISRKGESVWVSLKATPRTQQYLNTLLGSRKCEDLKAKTSKKCGIKNADGRKKIKKF